MDADGEVFLIRHAQDDPHHIAEVVESPASAGALAVSRPDLMLRLGGLYYLGRGLSLDGTTGEKGKRLRSRFSRGYASPFGQFDDDDELGEDGVRDHDPKQSRHLAMFPLGNNRANPALGPFLALLTAHNVEGLRLIGAVVDAATVARQRLEAGFKSNEPSITLQLRIGEPPTAHDFSGPATVWCWHRRTTVGPRPAQSALMALRQWASAQIINGVPVVVVRDQILNTGVSLAFAAVAWFVMLEHLDHQVRHPYAAHGSPALLGRTPDRRRRPANPSPVACATVTAPRRFATTRRGLAPATRPWLRRSVLERLRRHGSTNLRNVISPLDVEEPSLRHPIRQATRMSKQHALSLPTVSGETEYDERGRG